MKCPKCGYWNKPSFPHCFRCGEPLSSDWKEPSWKERYAGSRPAKIHKLYDDTQPAQDPVFQPAEEEKAPVEAALAEEMNRLKTRRVRGNEYLRGLRERAASEGYAPSGETITAQRASRIFDDVPDDPDTTLSQPYKVVKERGRRRVLRSVGKRRSETPFTAGETVAEGFSDADIPPMFDSQLSLPPHYKPEKKHRIRGAFAASLILLRILAVAAIAFVLWMGYTFLIAPHGGDSTETARYTLAETTVDGFPAHHIEIAGEEGTQIYIAEMARSYVVVDGVIALDVPDYLFYDGIDNLEAERMTVTLSPTVVTVGKEAALSPITYEVEIPLSEVELISPETEWVEVSTSIYGLEFIVAPQSKVTVNGVDISDTLDDSGRVTYNPQVRAIGENLVGITVRSPHCRENNFSLIFYREPMDITLELAADTMLSTSSNYMSILAYTEPGATVTVETECANLDVSRVPVTGEFSFDAAMSRVGYNTIVIRASMEGREDSVLKHTVYYLPPAATYTPRAWALTRTDYNELIANITMRAERAQIYLCRGVITQILAESPQLAIMDTTLDGAEQPVMLQNESSTTWVVGQRYRVYADVSGMYNTMPRLIGRYTYSE